MRGKRGRLEFTYSWKSRSIRSHPCRRYSSLVYKTKRFKSCKLVVVRRESDCCLITDREEEISGRGRGKRVLYRRANRAKRESRFRHRNPTHMFAQGNQIRGMYLPPRMHGEGVPSPQTTHAQVCAHCAACRGTWSHDVRHTSRGAPAADMVLGRVSAWAASCRRVGFASGWLGPSTPASNPGRDYQTGGLVDVPRVRLLLAPASRQWVAWCGERRQGAPVPLITHNPRQRGTPDPSLLHKHHQRVSASRRPPPTLIRSPLQLPPWEPLPGLANKVSFSNSCRWF